jgi:ribosomal-protein-alanine N-acetyltransferase
MAGVIRHAERLDPETLAGMCEQETAIHGECGFRRWELPIFADHGRNLIYEVDGETAGLAQLVRDWQSPDKAYLAGFGILPAARGRGVGREFLKEVIRDAADSGISEIELTVDPKNLPGIRIYTEAGFEVVQRQDAKYGPGEDRIVMRLKIKGE